jgi:hypothetical protein
VQDALYKKSNWLEWTRDKTIRDVYGLHPFSKFILTQTHMIIQRHYAS